MPGSTPRAAFRLAVALLLTLVSISGCGEGPIDPVPPRAGGIQVDVSTSGADPDPDGYLATLDGTGPALPLPATGSAGFPEVAEGNHAVALGGLAPNCTVDAASKAVNVVAGATATVGFDVSCAAIPSDVGSIRVVTSTVGSNLDPDGYQFAIDNGPPQNIAVTSTATVTDVAPGPHTVMLSGIASNCGMTGVRSKVVTVTGGDTAGAVFPLTCYAMGPSPSLSTISLDPATISVTGTSLIIVAVVDPSGTPMPGIEVAVTASGTGNSIGPWPAAESGITNSSGVATFSFASTVPEAKTITATAGGISLEAAPVLTVTKGVSLVGIREIVPEPSRASETVVVTVFVGGERGTRPTGGTVAVSSSLEPDAGCDAAPVTPESETVASATCEMTLSIVSTHMLTATYSGDSQYEGSSGTPSEHVVIAP
jgi:hypothetical protein